MLVLTCADDYVGVADIASSTRPLYEHSLMQAEMQGIALETGISTSLVSLFSARMQGKKKRSSQITCEDYSHFTCLLSCVQMHAVKSYTTERRRAYQLERNGVLALASLIKQIQSKKKHTPAVFAPVSMPVPSPIRMQMPPLSATRFNAIRVAASKLLESEVKQKALAVAAAGSIPSGSGPTAPPHVLRFSAAPPITLVDAKSKPKVDLRKLMAAYTKHDDAAPAPTIAAASEPASEPASTPVSALPVISNAVPIAPSLDSSSVSSPSRLKLQVPSSSHSPSSGSAGGEQQHPQPAGAAQSPSSGRSDSSWEIEDGGAHKEEDAN